MIAPAFNTVDRSGASKVALGAAIVVLGIAFFLTEHDLHQSRPESRSSAVEHFELSVETGSTRRQIGFSLVAAVGLAFLFCRDGRSLRPADPMVLLVALFLAWSALSLLWSADPALTARRIGVLTFCVVGALGVSRRFSARQLSVLAMGVLGTYCALGIAAEAALGTFRPFSADYRFGGTVHPNAQGVYCAALCLAAATHVGRSRRQTALALSVFALSAVLLLMTRSRTPCAALAVALTTVVLMRSSPRQRLLAAVGGTWAVVTAAMVCSLCSTARERQLTSLALLGRTEQAASLSGRIPLWTELLHYVGERPLWGYGYDSFWTPEHIADVSEAAQWATCSAHSAYLEVVLSVGLIGSAILFSAVGLGLCRLGARYLATKQGGCEFLFGLLVFRSVTGVLESGFLQPAFVPFIAGCGLLHVVFHKEPSLK